MRITATSEKKPQVIGEYYAYTQGNDWYSGVRLVAWISQNVNVNPGKTTLYFKWQRNQYNYWAYDINSNNYSVSIAGTEKKDKFSLPDVQKNGAYDLTKPQSITLTHAADGTYSGTLSVAGYKPWETFTDSISVVLPTITVVIPEDPDEPTPDAEPPAPLEFDGIPYYSIYADDELVYAAGIDGYDVINPRLSLEISKAGSLKFDIPVGSEMYGKLNKLSTTIEVRQGNEPIFRGRLLNTRRSFNNTLSCYCEGFLSWLNDIVFLPMSEPFSGQARDLLKVYLERYNSRASDNRKIEYIYSDVSAKISVQTEDYSTAWNDIKKVLIDGVGGYLVPYLTDEVTGLQWLSTYGTNDSQVIRFGENLLDFEEYIDASNVFTAVRPLGKKVNDQRIGLTGGSSFVWDAAAVAMFGRIERTAIFDEITDPAVLRTAGEEYLRTGLQVATSLNLKAADLHLLKADVDKIRVGNALRVVSTPHEIDAFFVCSKADLNLGDPGKNEYTFGATQRTISELTNADYDKYVITEGA